MPYYVSSCNLQLNQLGSDSQLKVKEPNHATFSLRNRLDGNHRGTVRSHRGLGFHTHFPSKKKKD